jgi:multiple sugar transport system substrate-binding protein
MTRRLLHVVLLSLLFILIIYQNAIFLSLSNTPISASDDELTVFGLWTGAEESNFRLVLDNFTTETGITVNYTALNSLDLQPVVNNELEGGTSSADIVMAPWAPWILDLASQGHLIEVTSLINASNYPTNIISLVTDDEGKIFAAPFKLSAKPGFWYKKSFFANHGLSVPTTFDEFNNTLLPAIQAISGIEAAIASGDSVGWPLSDQAEGFLMGLGGHQLQEELIAGPRQRNWTDSQVVSVFSNLTQLLEAGYFSAPAEWTSQLTKFWNAQYGLYWMGSWITTQSQIVNLTDLDFFGFPGTDGVAGAVDYAFVPKYAQHVNETELLLQYLASAEAQETMVRLGGFLAPNLNVPVDAYRSIDKEIVDFIAQPSIHFVPDLDDAIGGVFQTTFWDQMALLWTSPSTATMNSVLNTLQTTALQQQGTGVWTVDDDGPANFNTIQAAINAATQGDTILVYNGTYQENVVLNKSLSLIGENTISTVIDSNSAGNVISVITSNANITGFTIQNSGAMADGVYVEGDHITIQDNNITNNGYGIFIYSSENNLISNNVVDNNGYDGIFLNFADGNFITNNTCQYNGWNGIRSGIELWNSENNLISNNTCPSNYDRGISLSLSDQNIISYNICEDNHYHGIHLDDSSNNTISNNCCANNTNNGISLWEALNNNVSGNNLTANNYNGIFLYYSSGNIISGNNMAGNNYSGIGLEGSSTNIISSNNITNNGFGIGFWGSSDNTLYHNNFVENTQQVYFNDSGYANTWDDGYPSGGNYWSDYGERYPNATEIDDSGIWDTPYLIDESNQDNYPLIPEFSSFLALSVFMIATLLSVIIYAKKHRT